MDFVKGKVYFHKADGRRLVYISPMGKQHTFRYLGLRDYEYHLDNFWDYEVDEMAPISTNYKQWSLE